MKFNVGYDNLKLLFLGVNMCSKVPLLFSGRAYHSQSAASGTGEEPKKTKTSHKVHIAVALWVKHILCSCKFF